MKIVKKSISKCIPSWIAFLDWFLIDFGSQLGPPDPRKSSPRCSQSLIFEKSPFEVNIDFWSNFGTNLPSFWYQKSIKIPKKSTPRGIKKMRHLRIDNFCHVGPVLVPKFRQLGRQWRHLGTQEPPTWPPRGLLELDRGNHFSQFLPKRPRRGCTPWARGGKSGFWNDFGAKCHRFYKKFGWIFALTLDQILYWCWLQRSLAALRRPPLIFGPNLVSKIFPNH